MRYPHRWMKPSTHFSLLIRESGDQWAAEGHWTESEIADAQHEAREWLQLHTNIASRLGLLEEVSA